MDSSEARAGVGASWPLHSRGLTLSMLDPSARRLGYHRPQGSRVVHNPPDLRQEAEGEVTLFGRGGRGNTRVSLSYLVEFIPIKPSVAKGLDVPGSCAGHSRVPSPDR